jgi:hypothetical protein
MAARISKRLLKKYFDMLRKSFEDSLEQTEQAKQIRQIHLFVLRKWRRKETEFVFRSWVHATARMGKIRQKLEVLVAGKKKQIQQTCFDMWQAQAKEITSEKKILHSFILRLNNLSVNKTFITWKVHAKQNITNRAKLKRFVMQYNNRIVTICLRRWKIFVKDRVTVKINLEGIDRYVLLERSVAAWRYLTKRRRLHQRTGRLIVRSTHTRIVRCGLFFFFFFFLLLLLRNSHSFSHSFSHLFSHSFSHTLTHINSHARNSPLCSCSRHFTEWTRVVGHLAFTGNRRALLLDSMRRWSNSVACLKAAKVSARRSEAKRKLWKEDVIAPYQERIRRLEFELAQIDASTQSDSQEKHMLHAYLSHSAQRSEFALEVIKQLRRKLT